MKKKGKRQIAAVIAAIICSLHPLACTEVRADVNENKYTEQGQTILCLDKGSITISETNVIGYDKNGRAVNQVNEKGYYITTSEKGADTSGKTIEISKADNVNLADIYGGELCCYNVEKLTISGNVGLKVNTMSIPILQGEGENAVFDIGRERIESFGEMKISNLQVKASEVTAGTLILENSKVDVLERLKTYRGKMENSTINTPEFSMEIGGMETNAKMEINNCNISADEIRISGMEEVNFCNSEINSKGFILQADRVDITKNILNGIYLADNNMKIKFNHCKVKVNSDEVVIPDTINGGYEVPSGLLVSGGKYDKEKKEYISKALCEITIENGSEFSFQKCTIDFLDFVNLNIDGSTLNAVIDYEDDGLIMPVIGGSCRDGQKHIQIKLADNVMIADGKDIEWDEDIEGRFYLSSVTATGSYEDTNEIKIILKNGN